MILLFYDCVQIRRHKIDYSEALDEWLGNLLEVLSVMENVVAGQKCNISGNFDILSINEIDMGSLLFENVFFF